MAVRNVCVVVVVSATTACVCDSAHAQAASNARIGIKWISNNSIFRPRVRTRVGSFAPLRLLIVFRVQKATGERALVAIARRVCLVIAACRAASLRLYGRRWRRPPWHRDKLLYVYTLRWSERDARRYRTA